MLMLDTHFEGYDYVEKHSINLIVVFVKEILSWGVTNKNNGLGNHHKLGVDLWKYIQFVQKLTEGTHVKGNHLCEIYPAVVFVKETLPCVWPMPR